MYRLCESELNELIVLCFPPVLVLIVLGNALHSSRARFYSNLFPRILICKLRSVRIDLLSQIFVDED